MAITVEQSPPTYSPIYNEAVYVLSSDNSQNENFSIRATIKDSEDNTLALVKVPPRPDELIVIDIGRIVESEVSFDFAKILNQETGIDRAAVSERYTVEFQEEFGSTPAATGSITTASGYAYNAAMRYQDFVTYDQNEWLCVDAAAKFLTNSPRNLNIRENESAELGIMLDSEIDYFSVKTYNSSGTLIQEATLINTLGFQDRDKFLMLLTGTDDLNETTFDTGTQPIIDSSVYSYTVQARIGDPAGINSAASELFTYTIDRDCTRYTPIRLHFLNRMGRFDSFTFKMLSRQSVKKDTKQFKRFTGEVSGTTYSNSQSARGNVVFDTQSDYSIEANSDWISEEESDWLKELFDSPVVFWQQAPGTPNSTFAITITDSSYEIKERVNDRLFNYTIRFDLAIQDARQRA